MTDAPRVPALEQIAEFLSALATKRRLTVAFADPGSAQKAELLARTGRDFFAATPELAAAIRDGLVRSIQPQMLLQGRFGAETFADLITSLARGHIVKRFLDQGGDITLAPLSPAYRAWKGAHGLSQLIGLATRALFMDVRLRARFSVE